jgi:hypothetical protein
MHKNTMVLIKHQSMILKNSEALKAARPDGLVAVIQMFVIHLCFPVVSFGGCALVAGPYLFFGG